MSISPRSRSVIRDSKGAPASRPATCSPGVPRASSSRTAAIMVSQNSRRSLTALIGPAAGCRNGLPSALRPREIWPPTTRVTPLSAASFSTAFRYGTMLCR
ncbi:MAG: hypothetical protein DYH19_08280 [Gammaproteobacteria bacterium PRO8]|nr:hypothetical protein [Gammaproteobacteria bacterium PRO8]